MIIQIPLSGGLNTQADPEGIGVNAATELINAYVDKPGMIRKKPGRGDAVSVAANINHISKWIYAGTAYYVVTATDGNIYITTDIGTLGSTKYDATGTDVKILNYGTQLRFATGLDDADEAKLYTNIDRKFFWSGYTYSTGLTMTTARPKAFGEQATGWTLYDAGQVCNARNGSVALNWQAGTDWEPQLSADGEAPLMPSGFAYTTDTYYYKLTFVYDGNQESSIPQDVFVNSGYVNQKTALDSNFFTKAGDDDYFGFMLSIQENLFDERITAVNVYRSKNDASGPYYKIDTISTLSKDPTDKLADPGIIRVTDAKVLRAHTSEATGTIYITTASPTTLGTGESITVTQGTTVIGKVGPSGSDIGTYDGEGFLVNIVEVSGGATLGGGLFWDEPITWSGGSGKLYATQNNNILYSATWDLPVDGYIGAPMAIEGNDFTDLGTANVITDTDNDMFAMVGRNLRKIVALNPENDSTSPATGWLGNTETGIEVMIHQNYMWQDRGANHLCWWFDKRFTDGATHPFGTASIRTKFKHSVNLDGRQYVANVKIYDASGLSELHPDWVIFSELLQPDVIPITNYISIPDIQGGEITGLARLLGDLIIFQEKGIYRLAVPSADPTTWSLSESEPNLGCISTNSITEYENGVFFAGRDNLFYLNANFEALPITGSIRDDYQASTNLQNTRMHIDPKKERLLCRLGNTVDTTYVLDLKAMRAGSEHWTKLDNTGSKNAHLFLTDENFVTHTVEAGSTSYLCELDPSSPSESTSFKRTTGWIAINDLDRPGTLNRINLRYKSPDALTVKIYTDGDTSTAIAWQDGSTSATIAASSSETFVRVKPAIRCRYYMIEISSATSTNAVEIYRMETDFG